MLVKSVFVELRSRLRSCNVFIKTGISFSKNCNLKVSIQSNCIVLNYYGEERKVRRDSLSSIESLSDCSEDECIEESSISIREFCQIIPNSMSCLKIEKDTISFRLLTEPENGGNFYKEMLSPKTIVNIKPSELKINVKIDSGVKITCGNCSNVISKDVITFSRVLELPSENIDMSEWFCHGHCHGNSSQAEIELKPNKTDFLYRLTYFLLDNTLLSEKSNTFNAKRDVFHCNRCLAWLGLKSKDMIKLFNSEIALEDSYDKTVFTYKTSIGNKPTNDFIFTIETIMKEFDLGFQYTIMCKMVLECKISATKKHYLLIWIMDKELQVLKEKTIGDTVKLQSNFVTKLLYKVELELNNEVETWLEDSSVVTADISKSMYNNGIKHLEKMSLKVPETFRHTNGFCISFLKF